MLKTQRKNLAAHLEKVKLCSLDERRRRKNNEERNHFWNVMTKKMTFSLTFASFKNSSPRVVCPWECFAMFYHDLLIHVSALCIFTFVWVWSWQTCTWKELKVYYCYNCSVLLLEIFAQDNVGMKHRSVVTELHKIELILKWRPYT